MPQKPSKKLLATLRREAVSLSADYEQTPLANEKQGAEVAIRSALNQILPSDMPEAWYLGVMWMTSFSIDTMERAQKVKPQLLLPGKAPAKPEGKFYYTVSHMGGLAALRATQAKNAQREGHGPKEKAY